MTYFWVPNVLCEMQDGKAYLSGEDKRRARCAGTCHACEGFLGVDLSDTGKPYFRSCCTQMQLKPEPLSQRGH